MPILAFENSHLEGVRHLRDAIFGALNLSQFVWQPCQQIESLGQQCIKYVYADQQIIGYASAYQLDSTHFRLNLIVDPNHTRRGIGSLLLEKIENKVRQCGGQYLQARLFADMPKSLHFALARGYNQIHIMQGMSLRKTDFSFLKWKDLGEKLSAMGFLITTLQDELEANNNPIEKLAELYKRAREDWPSPDPSWRLADSEQDSRSPFAKVSIPQEFRIMKNKNDYIGFTSATNQTPGTGVHPDFRNLGVATYLKAFDIDRCIENGKDYFESASASPAMRRVNEKLGYSFNGLSEVRLVKKIV